MLLDGPPLMGEAHHPSDCYVIRGRSVLSNESDRPDPRERFRRALLDLLPAGIMTIVDFA